MKKILISILFTTIILNISAQIKAAEPDFIGETIVVKKDNSTQILEKKAVKIKTKAGAGLYVFGVGKVKSKISIDGCCSSVRLKAGEPISLIVKAVDNLTDPMAIIAVFKFDKTQKERKAELSSTGTFEGDSQNNFKMVAYTATKYGKSSYLLKIEIPVEGEFGIIVKNPNALNNANTIVACYGVDL
jgi:hypothetical protein